MTDITEKEIQAQLDKIIAVQDFMLRQLIDINLKLTEIILRMPSVEY